MGSVSYGDNRKHSKEKLMDPDEDQQALAWQWIIRNKAFDNVRVQRGESWVDAACRTLDELINQKESLDKEFAKLMSDYQDVEDERDEWKARADKWHVAWQRSAPVSISSADIDRALINVISNAMNYPDPVQILGKDTGPLRKKCVDAVCDLFGIETEPADPVEAKARELFEATDESIWTWATAPVQTQDMYRRIAEHVLGQEAGDE